jgi:hypothetical protein
MPLGGTWSSVDPPQRSGLFVNIDTVAPVAPVANASGTVGLVITADWGPVNEIVDVTTASEASSFYGPDSTAAWVVTQALRGEGVTDRGGASTVRVYRAAASSAANATLALANTAGTPATAITLTSLYKGTRGNSFKATVQTNAVDSALKDILIYEGTRLMESYTSLTANAITDIVALINDQSSLVTATAGATGTALANVASASFSGGASGSTLTGTEHTAAQAAFEAYGGFSAFAVHGLTDGTIRGTYKDWTDRLNSEGKTFVTVFGGAASESASTAITRTTALDSPYCVNLFGDLSIGGNTYASSQMTSRVAGIIAASGSTRSVSFSQFADATIVSPPSNAQVETLVRGSVVSFFFDGTVVRLQRARTTLRTTSESKPEKFKSLLYVRKVQETLRGLDDVAASFLGAAGFANTDTGRAAILTAFKTKLDDLVSRGVALPGGNVYYDDSQDNTGESLYILFTLDMAPGVEQVLGRIAIPA